MDRGPREGAHEDFLVPLGTRLLPIEGEERRLRAWDLVHCPPQTAHTLVAVEGPCVVLQLGAPGRGRRRVPVAYGGRLD